MAEPTAEEIARAIVREQEKAAAKRGSALSDVLAWGGLLLVGPAGVAAYLFGGLELRGVSTILCAAAPLMIIVGAIIGSVAKSRAK